MNKLKSMEELQKIREAAKAKIDLRATAESEDRIIIRVGMATCGIASGARETMRAIIDEIARQNIPNISVTQTGCMGYCAEEPIIEVISKDMPSVIYGHVDEERAREIVKEHIMNGRLLQNAIIAKSFEK
ncbi:MAG TPA: (2Fe-2S) ferredoxin domain-containing protein [Clostridiales bacterium]|nr:(2Fe-2S) ferredoxin domain-containing protein [Clostridiales bacterium]